MMSDRSYTIDTESNGSSTGSTESTIIVNDGEASFPAPEELRNSSTSRSTGTGSNSMNNNKTIWFGAAATSATTRSDDDHSNSCMKKLSRRYCRMGSIAVAVLVLLVILPAVVVSNKKNRRNNNIPQDFGSYDANASSERFDAIKNYVIEQGISSDADISTTGTSEYIPPQSKAIYWLANNDEANVPIPSSSTSDISTFEGYMFMVRYVMAVTFFAMNGNEWLSDLTFLSEKDVCNWNADVYKYDTIFRMGLYCATEPGESAGEYVSMPISLTLDENNLMGTIPSEIGKLTSLLDVKLVNSDLLMGSIPSELCQLSNVRSLHLSYNQLTGAIPYCWNDMTALEMLDLDGNLFNNELPVALCQVSKLSELHLAMNEFTGSIPSCLGSLPVLTHFVVHGNRLENEIPSELCNLKELLNLDVGTNLLTGQIPSCIGSVPFLEGIDFSDNYLDGTVPAGFTALSNALHILLLDDNELVGDPSDVFNNLVQLRVLGTANNNFTYTIDSSFLVKTRSLVNLDMSNNNITGAFPFHLLNYPSLRTLDLSSNDLTGEITDGINVNEVLEVFAVHNNMMQGSISSVAKLTKLFHLDLSNNRFTGSIDPVGTLVQMQNLFLSENPFDAGPIPESLKDLLNLQELSLRNTNRTGVLLDPDVNNWKSMIYIDFGSNNLEGAIPESYGKLPELQYFILHDNEFINGNIPSTFQSSTKLIGVFLDGTSITEASTIGLLCDLPTFNNGTDTIGVEVFIVNCKGDCTEQCVSCVCCDAVENPTLCSNPFLNEFDMSLNEVFRRTTNFFSIDEYVTSTFEDDARK